MKVNGTLIGQVYAHNEGYVGATNTCKYTYHLYQMDLRGKPSIIEGSLEHERDAGFNVLAEKIFADASL